MPEKIKTLLKSRRFWTAVGGVIVVSLNELLSITEDTANTIVGIAVDWIVGDSLRVTE